MSLNTQDKNTIETNNIPVSRSEVNSDSENLFEEYYDEQGNLISSNDNLSYTIKKGPVINEPDDSLCMKNSSTASISMGATKSQLNTNLQLPRIVVSSASPRRKGKVFVRWPLVRKGTGLVVPQPYPECLVKDRWDEDHVRMPCSPQSQFPVTIDGIKVLKGRWTLIEEALRPTRKIKDVNDLEERILSYNRSGRWTFDSIKYMFDNDEEETEQKFFFDSILPEMCSLALKLPYIVTAPIPLLRKGCNKSITFSQFQIASLLANAFFCTFPRRNATGKQTEYANFPIINFNRLFGIGELNNEKLRCLINYFRRATRGEPLKGLVTFTRRCISSSLVPRWRSSTKRLLQLRITSVGKIEDDGTGMLQVRTHVA